MPRYPTGLDHDTRKTPPAPPGDTPAIGERIRRLRKAAGLTLESLSTASGLSRAALSKIERDEGSPTYDSLLKLARGLAIDLAALVADQPPAADEVAVTRAGEGAAYEDTRYAHRLLVPGQSARGLLAFETEVRITRIEDYGPWDRHDSEDILYVLEGTVAVHLEHRSPIALRHGDAMRMDSRVAHALIAVPTGDERSGQTVVARVLWVSALFA